MAKLIYVTNVSLDGFIEDEHGSFGWTEPDDQQFAFVTDLVRPIGTYIYGRRLYETMAVWETDPSMAAPSELRADFARVWLFIGPAILGRGKPSFPNELRAKLELLDERRFDNGVVYVRHRIVL